MWVYTRNIHLSSIDGQTYQRGIYQVRLYTPGTHFLTITKGCEINTMNISHISK
nr:MAG TPA: hypothetical protein [Caudoviricetes sp.]